MTDIPTQREPLDAVPPTVDVEFPCKVCGREAGPWSGRGRKPSKCPEHRRGGVPAAAAVGAVSRETTKTGTNATLAKQAVEALCQLNAFGAIGAMLAGYPMTASQISAGDEGFREQAYAALITDPDLCRTILKAGTTSGKVALVMAYGMYLVPVGSTAVMEHREKMSGEEE